MRKSRYPYQAADVSDRNTNGSVWGCDQQQLGRRRYQALRTCGMMDGMDSTEDPHGFLRRMRDLSITQAQLSADLGVVPNTIARALKTTAKSTVRDRIDRYLAEREAPDVRIEVLAHSDGGTLIRVSRDGKTTTLSFPHPEVSLDEAMAAARRFATDE